jgi:hypothetical protein
MMISTDAGNGRTAGCLNCVLHSKGQGIELKPGRAREHGQHAEHPSRLVRGRPGPASAMALSGEFVAP